VDPSPGQHLQNWPGSTAVPHTDYTRARARGDWATYDCAAEGAGRENRNKTSTAEVRRRGENRGGSAESCTVMCDGPKLSGVMNRIPPFREHRERMGTRLWARQVAGTFSPSQQFTTKKPDLISSRLTSRGCGVNRRGCFVPQNFLKHFRIATHLPRAMKDEQAQHRSTWEAPVETGIVALRKFCSCNL
jgi:hypothetical protein